MYKRRRGTVTDTARTCNKCEVLKPFSAFYKDKYNPIGLTTICRVCMNAAALKYRGTPEGKILSQQRWKAWRKNNPEKFRDQWLLRNYNITGKQFDEMFAAQGNKCLICKTQETGKTGTHDKRFHVDHCHDEGHVRGILCRNCNVGIGHFLHRADLLQAAIDYLSQKSP